MPTLLNIHLFEVMTISLFLKRVLKELSLESLLEDITHFSLGQIRAHFYINEVCSKGTMP